jgi:hypothetical protein
VYQYILAFSAPSSKQKDPDLLCEKQASDDGYAATQIDSAYWAEFYSKSEMSQWFAQTNLWIIRMGACH